MKIILSIDKFEITSESDYNAIDCINNDVSGVINSPLKGLDDTFVLSIDILGELTNRLSSENHFIVSVKGSVKNSIGYLSLRSLGVMTKNIAPQFT